MPVSDAPMLPPVEGADIGFNPSFDSPDAPVAPSNGGSADAPAASPVEKAPPTPTPQQPTTQQPAEHQPDALDARAQEEVKRVLYSDIGVTTLLNRLKASIASARVRPPGLYPSPSTC